MENANLPISVIGAPDKSTVVSAEHPLNILSDILAIEVPDIFTVVRAVQFLNTEEPKLGLATCIVTVFKDVQLLKQLLPI